MKSLPIITDDEKDLIKAAQRGDLNAFNALILRYQNLLFGIALRMLGDEDTASDAVQEALISAFSKFRTFRGGSLRSWLARVTVNACYDEMRRKRRQREVPLEQFNVEGDEVEDLSWMVDPAARPEERYDSYEMESAIQESLGQLTPAYREALVLVDIEGLSYEEASVAAQVPVGTVKSRLARARLQIRSSLQGYRDLLPSQYVTDMACAVSVC
ncbi:MAG TPA: sigma-70 family RNA polymerase sigma factor [Anaerolineales bacterium]|nr:sigma-70 family RNA polymerase sigma factor [Anaerolineales bacterium]